MKISNSKKQLAKIISENGRWPDGALWAAQDKSHGGIDNKISFYDGGKPWFDGGYYWKGNGVHKTRILACELVKNWHQTILSRGEYFHLYPAPDADGWIEWKSQFYGDMPVPEGTEVDLMVDGTVYHRYVAEVWKHWGTTTKYRLYKSPVAQPEPEAPAKPAIEQLAADYRAKLAIAQQAQEEADSHRCGAEAALEKLYQAGLAIGLDIAIADSEPEDKRQPKLVITDWRDLQVGDEVMCVGHSWPGHFEGLTCEVIDVEREGYHGDAAIRVQSYSGGKSWGLDFKFIRRP